MERTSPRPPHGHLSPDEFREAGRRTVAWIADWYEKLEQLPVQPSVPPGWVRSRLPDHPPQQPEPLEAVLTDLEQVIVPGLTQWQSPNWFAYFPANSSPTSALGELLAAAFGVQGMMWSTGPACTELESLVLDWLVELLGLPDEFRCTGPGGGVLQDSASSSTFCALVAAREIARRSARLSDLAVYHSTEAHSSVTKGARLAGYEHIRAIPVDERYALRRDLLEIEMAKDRESGLVPAFTCATVGTTGSTAVDPVRAIGELCQQHRTWFHIDAAFAGSAMICPEMRALQDGVDLADSYTFNPHKWLLTNVDCSVLWVRDRQPLIDAMSITPPYLAAEHSAETIDYRDWQLPLGRRFRALKLWMVLRHYGAEQLQEMIRSHIQLGRDVESRLRADPRFEVLAPVPLSVVCFRHRRGDEVTRALHRALNERGPAYLTHTILGGSYAIRVAVGAARTEQRHVDALWQAIDELAPR